MLSLSPPGCGLGESLVKLGFMDELEKIRRVRLVSMIWKDPRTPR
jgi:hypothetical protein